MTDEQILKLQQTWLARAKACGHKGKARDRACLEYLVGAAAALEATADDAGRLTMFAFLVSVRGAKEFDNWTLAPTEVAA